MFLLIRFVILVAYMRLSLLVSAVVMTYVPESIIEISLYTGLPCAIYVSPSLFGEISYIWGLVFTLCLSLAYSSTFFQSRITQYFLNIVTYLTVGIYLDSVLIFVGSIVYFIMFRDFINGPCSKFIIEQESHKENPNKKTLPSAILGFGITALFGIYLNIFLQNIHNYIEPRYFLFNAAQSFN